LTVEICHEAKEEKYDLKIIYGHIQKPVVTEIPNIVTTGFTSTCAHKGTSNI
jgi:hypothetical protein